MEQTTIRKKQFYGDKALQAYAIPKGIVEIGDWAFAGCSNLRKLVIPDSVEKIGRDVFLGCEKLETVRLYRDTGEPTEESECETTEAMMAMALRYFQGVADVIAATREGYATWLSAWDQACQRFLESSDEEGFRPFLAGGEEDYADEEKERILYCGKRRLIKAKVIILRLLESKDHGGFYLYQLQKNDMALECIMLTWRLPGEVVAILEEAGVLTKESSKAVLEKLPTENVEMRALLLHKASEDLNAMTTRLWL